MNYSSKKDTSCLDDRGHIRRHQERWKEHDCKSCQCEVGVTDEYYTVRISSKIAQPIRLDK